MRWLVLSLVVPLILLAGLVGQPIKPAAVQTAATPLVVRVPIVPTPTVLAQPDGVLEQIMAAARSWLGVPYQWGGCNRRGVDCSCFVELVYAAVGIQVPRTTVTQVVFDRPVDRADLRPGDTVFFDNTCDHATCGPNPTHEGLYLGGGLMIDAGDPVQVESMFWSKFHSAGRPRQTSGSWGGLHCHRCLRHPGQAVHFSSNSVIIDAKRLEYGADFFRGDASFMHSALPIFGAWRASGVPCADTAPVIDQRHI